MRFARQLFRVPTARDALEAFALGDADAVDHVVLRENLLDGNLLLEMLARPVDLLGNRATIDLNLHNVRFLVAMLHYFDLK